MDLAEFFDESEVEAVRMCFGPAALPRLVIERVLELRIKRYDKGDVTGGRYLEFYKDGKLHKHKGWYKNGELMFRNHYVGGKEHGECVGWYENGKIRYRSNWVGGERHGTCEEWSKLGLKLVEIQYRDGKRHGKCMEWGGSRWYVNYYTDGQLQ